LRLPAVPTDVKKRSLRRVAAVAVGVVALGGVGLGVSRLPGVLAVTAAPLPAAPAIRLPTPVLPASPIPVAASSRPVVASPDPVMDPVRSFAAPQSAVVDAHVFAEDRAVSGYIIEVALFATTQRGARLADDLAAASFRAFHRPLDLGTRGFFRQVLIGPFATRAAADAELGRLHQRGGHDDARVAGGPSPLNQ
jgi:cell division septation protein DedD